MALLGWVNVCGDGWVNDGGFSHQKALIFISSFLTVLVICPIHSLLYHPIIGRITNLHGNPITEKTKLKIKSAMPIFSPLLREYSTTYTFLHENLLG
jgi:hypothetical protein